MAIWSVMHRKRKVMGRRVDLYQLSDMIKFDERYFEELAPEHTKSNLKRGQGSERQLNVAVMVESIPLENLKSDKISNQGRYFKMKILKSHPSAEVESLFKDSLDPKTVGLSDKSTSYFDIEKYVEAHIPEKSTTIVIPKWDI